MGEFVTITSQGQITIPVKLRREVGILNNSKLHAYRKGEAIVLEKPKDIFSIFGVFADKAIKGKPIQEVIRMEHEAIAEAVAERHERKMKRILKDLAKEKKSTSKKKI